MSAQIKSEWIEYPSRSASIRAYLAAPAGAGQWPGIVMIHENPGVTEHRMDVTRRLADQGCITLTPDLFSRIGGKPPSGESDVQRRQKIDVALPDDQVFDDLMRGYEYLKARPETVQNRIALYGICMGGGKGFYTVCRTDVFRCFVDFYGPIIVKAEVTPDGKERSYLPMALRFPVRCNTTSAIKMWCARWITWSNCMTSWRRVASNPGFSSIRARSMHFMTIQPGAITLRVRDWRGIARCSFSKST